MCVCVCVCCVLHNGRDTFHCHICTWPDLDTVVVFFQSSIVSSVDVVNPSVVRKPHVVWCIQQFDSQLNDVTVDLLSRLLATVLTTKKKVSCTILLLILLSDLVLSGYMVAQKSEALQLLTS